MPPTSHAPHGAPPDHRRVLRTVRRLRPIRFRHAVGPALVVLLVVASTAASTTATQPTVPATTVVSFTPITPSLVDGQAEAAAAREAVLDGANAVELPSAALEDPGMPPVPEYARPAQPAARPVAVSKVIRQPVRYAGGGHVLRGLASWYCNSNGSRGPISACYNAYPDTSGFDAYAAAGPRLRAAIGSGWRGKVISVDGLRVKLVDWCQCHKGQANEKLIDLYRDVYGVVGGSVTIRW
jgi:hypothetical protein